jgi:hypothetical protein
MLPVSKEDPMKANTRVYCIVDDVHHHEDQGVLFDNSLGGLSVAWDTDDIDDLDKDGHIVGYRDEMRVACVEEPEA